MTKHVDHQQRYQKEVGTNHFQVEEETGLEGASAVDVEGEYIANVCTTLATVCTSSLLFNHI